MRGSLRIRLIAASLLALLASLSVGFFALGMARSDPGAAMATGGFLFLGIFAGFWFYLDQALARPVDKIASELRIRAHAETGVPAFVPSRGAEHLGDLGPAAASVLSALEAARTARDEAVSAATRHLDEERVRLTALLSEIPVATILLNRDGQIVLYDGQAAEVLAQIGTPRLHAALSEYFDEESLRAALDRIHKTGLGTTATLQGRRGAVTFTATLKPMAEGGTLMIIDSEESRIAPDADRPLVYDFALLGQRRDAALEDRRLSDLTFCVFDLETTGLLPHRDEIIQIGAVRVIGGRIVPGEAFETLVDPGRPIPDASSRVHHITDAMVRGHPSISSAAPRFYDFASGSALVAHNAPFDLAFLRAKRAETELNWTHPVVDTVLLSAILFGTTETHTLDAVCQRLGIEIAPHLRHTALGDAHATAEALCRMLPMLEGRGIDTFGALLAETRKHGRLIEDMN